MTALKPSGLSLLALAALFTVQPALAADYADLPPQQAVLTALQQTPAVLAAAAGIQAQQAYGDMIKAGPYEWSVQGSDAQRRIFDTGQIQHDWSVGLTTTIRMPGKSGLDDKLAEQTVQSGTLSAGDAMHEAARKLLSIWFTWLSASAQSDLWQQQTGLLQQQVEAVRRRVRAGDAASVEIDLAQAARLQAQVAMEQANLRRNNATNLLHTYFPSLPLPEHCKPVPPQALDQPLAYWMETGLSDNHELQLARNASRIAQLRAKRADADLVPDPTVSVYYMSQREGLDTFTGVSVSVPITGTLRHRTSDAERARADMTLQKESQVEQRLRGEIGNAWNTAQSAWQNWQLTRSASELTGHNADKIAHAYTLGEASLNDVLLARRQQLDARLIETQAELDAAESRYRLMLDTHHLWPIEAASR